MGFISVLAAAVACWAFGAAYYMILAKPWVAASGVAVDENGKPTNDSPLPYVVSFLCMILVAGMLRHTFAMAGIDTLTKGVVAGAGVGAFFIAPWIVINNAYGDRPFRLSIIDGGYAICGCAIAGLILALF